jgi:hypothetical protein
VSIVPSSGRRAPSLNIINIEITNMSEPPSRQRQWCWLVAPILTARYDKWKARRERERRRARAQAERLAIPETYAPPEREPRTVDSIWTRMTQHRRQPWEAFADELRAERRALHRITRHHGITRAADNLGKFR